MIEFQLNGNAVSSDSPDDTPLLWVVRDELKLKGTKFGCGIAQCGKRTGWQPARGHGYKLGYRADPG